MKRLYVAGRVTTFTNPTITPDLISFVMPSLYPYKMGDVESKSVPTKAPTNRTKHAYTEQKVYDSTTNECVAIIREGKIETLNLTTNPFA